MCESHSDHSFLFLLLMLNILQGDLSAFRCPLGIKSACDSIMFPNLQAVISRGSLKIKTYHRTAY